MRVAPASARFGGVNQRLQRWSLGVISNELLDEVVHFRWKPGDVTDDGGLLLGRFAMQLLRRVRGCPFGSRLGPLRVRLVLWRGLRLERWQDAGRGVVGTTLVPFVPGKRTTIGPDSPRLLLIKASLTVFSASTITAILA